MSAPTLRPQDPGFVFNPLTPAFDRDPYPVLAALRREAPIYWWPEARGWFLTRHEDAVAVLSDEERFTPNQVHWEFYTPPPEESRNHPALRIRESNILSMEGSQHVRMRKLAFAALSRRAVRTIAPLMRQVIDELLEPLRTRGECELVSEVASTYPVGVISRLLGIEKNSDREKHFKGLADSIIVAFNPMIEEAAKLRSLHLMGKYIGEIEDLMEEKRAAPADDLMSHLIQVEEEGDHFTPDEILSLVCALLVAGSETTANSLAFGVLELLRHPDQRKQFMEDPSCRENAAYEVVRYHMPGRFLLRYAKHDTHIREIPIHKGQGVFVSVASAQRDPDFLDDPDRFDITRTPKDLSAFGVGRHFCIGAQLARLELEIGLERVFDAFPNLQLACGFEDIPYRNNPAVRGPAKLPLRFDPTGG